MPTEAQILATDRVPDRTEKKKRCPNCGHPKVAGEFASDRSRKGGLSSHCLLCLRIGRNTYYHEGGGKEVESAYRSRPEVKARKRAYDRTRKEQLKASKVAYMRTPRGRIAEYRRKARRKLRQPVTDGRRAEIESLIAAYDREIARLDAHKAAERTAELPAEPPKARAARSSRSPAKGVYCTKAGTFEVKISVGKARSVRGGTFATLDEARAAANELAFKLKGIRGYATPREARP
jgi:hypothetical protein